MEALNTTSKSPGFLSLLALIAITFCNLQATAQALNTMRNKNYTKPVYFDVFGPGKPAPKTQLEYDLESQKGQSLRLGSVIINEKTLSFGLRSLREIDTQYQGFDADTIFFLVNWPEYLFKEVKLEVLARDGKVAWSKNLLNAELKDWEKIVQNASQSNPQSSIKNINWGIELSRAQMPFDSLADGFRFCLSRYQVSSQERLCSQEYVIRKVKGQTLLGRFKTQKPARILINGEPAPFKAARDIKSDFPTRFYVQLTTGETYDFSSKPTRVNWADFVRTEESGVLRLVGFDTFPVGRYQVLNPEKYPSWVEKFGFQPTIYDKRKFWAVMIKEETPFLYFPGETGGVFKHVLPLDSVPDSRIRLYLHKDTPSGTYQDGLILKGRKQQNVELNSREYSVLNGETSEEFEWSFKARKPAQMNRASLLLKDGSNTYTSYYELYKGYANELSGRTSLILSTSGAILLGELSYNHWFEKMLGWDNPTFSSQHWGFSTKYFQSLTEIKTADYEGGTLTVINADLKYRFTPGIWTRDETQGLMLSYQNVVADVEVTKFTAPLVGIGWFWARSMPQVFDELFNYLPFMNYPKWVDMEFIYYGMSLDSRIEPNVNMALNFHGQVLWKDNFFGEAGFGFKRYAFKDMENSYRQGIGYTLDTIYGTVGLGIKF